ncbi:hypothetical protein PMAYCL1PPCAC_23844, partial [Pristionchus mayeri]
DEMGMSSRSPLPSLPSIPPCECSRGGCISPSECIHRALRCFCSPSNCSLPSCSNRLSSSSNLFLSKGILRTKQPRKANEFLIEMVGEVMSLCTLASGLSSGTSNALRCFSFTPNHFIDTTIKGNLSRFVRHSCQPNSSIQLWWESGVAHLCIFTLFPLSSNCEITVDFSFLTPLPFSCSCSTRCTATIPPSVSLSLHQSTLHPVPPSHTLFLRRNLRHQPKLGTGTNNPLYTLYLYIHRKFHRNDGKVTRAFASFLYKLRSAAVNEERELFAGLLTHIQYITSDAVDTHSLSCLRNRLSRRGREEDESEKKKWRRNDFHPARHTDTSYLDSASPVGSYNPDEWKGGEKSRDEAVRCVCGVVEDEGEMIECDDCHFWLHSDCIQTPSTGSFSCPLCVSSTPSPHGDVLLKNQPDIRLDGCLYYKALENRKNLQMRVGECVYVRKLKSDKHKKILRSLDQRKGKRNEIMDEPKVMSEDWEESVLPRSELRVFRVERLFESPGGHRFLFGFYYARPHETFCDESRMFHPNEVFSTPFYDTLPLDVVVGKCLVMETSHFCQGRPIFPSYKEHDVLVCEYQLDRNQRHFDKCRNSYFLNTEPYAFQKFKKARTLQRCFTPFTYSSETSVKPACSMEETSRSLATKRINTVVERLTGRRRMQQSPNPPVIFEQTKSVA